MVANVASVHTTLFTSQNSLISTVFVQIVMMRGSYNAVWDAKEAWQEHTATARCGLRERVGLKAKRFV